MYTVRLPPRVLGMTRARIKSGLGACGVLIVHANWRRDPLAPKQANQSFRASYVSFEMRDNTSAILRAANWVQLVFVNTSSCVPVHSIHKYPYLGLTGTLEAGASCRQPPESKTAFRAGLDHLFEQPHLYRLVLWCDT